MSANKNFGLSESAFIKMMLLLQSGDNQLFKTIFMAHCANCISYIQKKYHARYEDAYDATLETMILFRSRLLQNKITYGNMNFLFTRMACQYYQRQKGLDFVAKASSDAELYDLTEEESIGEFEDVQFAKLKAAWNELGRECKELLRLNFYADVKLKDIAALKNKKASAIRKQKGRCLEKLTGIYFNLVTHLYD